MNIEDYEKFVDSVWVSGPEIGGNQSEWQIKYLKLRSLAIATMGLGGEAGEAQEKIKKLIRDGTYNKDDVIKELGDVLYYIARVSHELNFTLQEVLDKNVEKLSGRLKSGNIRGSGDNR